MYEWLFKDGNVNEGLECVAAPCRTWYYGYMEDIPATIVKLAGYWPYYTDGDLPDPTIDEVNEWCYIEVDGNVPDSQIRLDDLFPIKWEEKPVDVLYDGKEVELIGVAANGYGCSYCIILVNGERKCVDSDDVGAITHIWELSEEECEKLAHSVSRGSIWLSDYRNSLGVPEKEVSDYSDSYYWYLDEKYGDEYDESKDTVDEFAYFLYNEC